MAPDNDEMDRMAARIIAIDDKIAGGVHIAEIGALELEQRVLAVAMARAWAGGGR